ncbi:HPr kinase/phosphorylase [Aquabacter cavernae]|uniref:HPr kinase/phosphorylase n=1 Tax=Aquabacter cavernae TaxID=2496029 RepID=UPI000F8F1296|nr:HPr kinase/phosphatase C-terminal domain-containing protein [Aquabacter cavernae]
MSPAGHAPSIHASCVALDGAGVLIRGPSGSGKSTLALRLILDAPRSLPPAMLVADDRVLLEARDGHLHASAPEPLAGLIEARNLGIRRLSPVQSCPIRLVMDLAAADAQRLPEPVHAQVILEGIPLFRIAVPPGADGALLVAAWFGTEIF